MLHANNIAIRGWHLEGSGGHEKDWPGGGGGRARLQTHLAFGYDRKSKLEKASGDPEVVS
jgi:hypothetical protein